MLVGKFTISSVIEKILIWKVAEWISEDGTAWRLLERSVFLHNWRFRNFVKLDIFVEETELGRVLAAVAFNFVFVLLEQEARTLVEPKTYNILLFEVPDRWESDDCDHIDQILSAKRTKLSKRSFMACGNYGM